MRSQLDFKAAGVLNGNINVGGCYEAPVGVTDSLPVKPLCNLRCGRAQTCNQAASGAHMRVLHHEIPK